MLRQMAGVTLTLGEAASALGVSVDTLRRWDRAGKLRTVRDARNRRLVPRAEVERLSARPRRHATGDRLLGAQPLPRRRALGRGRRRDGARRDRGRPVPRHRRDHARLGRGARARPGRRRDRDGEGDVGDDRAKGLRVRKRLTAALLRGDRGSGDGGVRQQLQRRREHQRRRGRGADRLGRLVAEGRLHRLREIARRRGPLLVRRLRRARRADPTGRQARRLRRRQHEAARRAATPRGSSSSPVAFAGNRLVLAVPAGTAASARSTDLPKPGDDDRDRLGRACRSAPTRATCSTGCGPRQRKAILANVRSERARRRRASSASSRRARSTPASSTSPTCSAADGELKAIELPAELQPQVAYGVAVVKGAPHPTQAQRVRRRPARRRRRRARCRRPASAAAAAVRRDEPPGWFPALLALSLARRADVPDAAGRRDLRRHRSPRELLDSLGDPASRDALRLSLETTTIALAMIVRRRDAGRVPARDAAASAAARSSSRWSSCRSCCRRPSPASACSPRSGPNGLLGGALEDAGIQLVLQTAGVVVALMFVAAPFYVRAGAGGVRGGRPDAGSRRRARSAPARRARSRASRSRRALPGLGAGLRAGLGARAGRVRRDADVRRLLPRHHADRAAGDLRALRDRLRPAALALSAVLVAVSAALLLSVKLLARDAARSRAETRRRRGSTSTSRWRSPPASCLALAGPSGAGKTSVLRVVAGLLRPARGRVVCGERDVARHGARASTSRPSARRCGYVFQDYALFGHLSAWQNVAYGLRDVPRARRRGEALALLERFGVAALADARPGRCRAASASGSRSRGRSAPRPRALLLDEPLSALDARTRAAAGARAGRSCCASCRSRRCSSRTTSPRRRCSATASRVIDAGRIVQRGSAARARRGARLGVRRRLHRRGRAARARAGAGADGLTRVDARRRRRRSSAPTPATGPVAVSVYPWEIALEPPGSAARPARRRTGSTPRSSRSPRSATACASGSRRRSRSPPSSPARPATRARPRAGRAGGGDAGRPRQRACCRAEDPLEAALWGSARCR